MILKKAPRKFLAKVVSIDNWSTLHPYFSNLINRVIDSKEDLINWLENRSEMDAVLEEDLAWRYIQMTIDTRDANLSASYSFFINEIAPNIAPYEDKLNKKLMDCPFTEELKGDSAYQIYFRSVETSIALFREENIPLETEAQEKAKQFGSISAAQTIEWEGKNMTMQQAAQLLKQQDPALRENIFKLTTARREEDIDALNDLYDELIQLRHKVAVNAGFENYRDYKFESMGRFDYSKEDCFDFHESIKKHIVPIARKLQAEHARKLGTDKVKPWDLDVDPDGKSPLKPFEDGVDLLEKTKKIFAELDPYFYNSLVTMDEMKHLDLDSKEGKAPGGYNYPLYEIGVPFIFMNAAGSHRDVVTMIHEGGHAVHSFLSRDLALTSFKNLPSEVAELASMSMELLSMDHWDHFYSNEDDLNRAKTEHLEDIIKVLPWIATIDAFQHWIYSNPTHTRSEREDKWLELQEEYGNPLVDWTGFENARKHTWQRQLHLFEVPFYYIEYGIAQLGAVAIWKNALEDKAKAIQAYKDALSLGYTKSIPEIYETANITFGFSNENVKEIAEFLEKRL